MKIKTVAVLGSGAVGSYFVWGLMDKCKADLYVPARGERKARLETEGIRINGETYRPSIVEPKDIYGVDLILLAVKYNAIEEAIDMIAEMADPRHTIILSLMNGVDSEEKIEKAIHPEHLLYSFMKIQSTRVGREISFDPDRTLGLFYGYPGVDKEDGREDLLALKELLSDSPIHYNFCPEIMKDLWGKYAMNIANNLVQAVLDVGIGAYEDSPYVKELGQKLRDEVVAVAHAKGIEISSLMENPIMKRYARKNSAYSTLQDIRAGRETEIEMFSGALLRMGAELGVPTPVNETVYLFIKAIEEKNKGKFDYSDEE